MSESEKRNFLEGYENLKISDFKPKMFTLKLPSWSDMRFESQNYHFDSRILSDDLSDIEKVENILNMILIPKDSITLKLISEIFDVMGIDISLKDLNNVVISFVNKNKDKFPDFSAQRGIYYGIGI